jgi:hypothetical protein
VRTPVVRGYRSRVPNVGDICILVSMFTEEERLRVAEWSKRRGALRATLAELGDRRRQLLAAQAEVSSELRRVLPEAAAMSFGVSELARLAGLTRRSVYLILNDAKTTPQ